MTPTRIRTLALLALVAAAVGFTVATAAYGNVPSLPSYTPLTTAIIGIFELGLARVVWLKVHGRSRGPLMHPLQIARAAVLAKASAAGGALVLGLYAGFLGWTATHLELSAASKDSLIAALAVGACLLLVVGALALERACRRPPDRDQL